MGQFFESALSFFKETQEYRGWGFNLLTIGFLIIMLDGAVTLWGTWSQSATLWQAKSAAGVSVPMRITTAAYYFVAVGYGVDLKSIALMGGLPMALLQFSVVVALWRIHRGYIWFEWLVAALGAVVAALSFFPQFGGIIYGNISFLLVIMYLDQPFKMWRNKSAEGVNWREPAVYALTTIVWSIYAVIIGSMVILVFSLIFLVLYVLVLTLYRKYRTFAPRSS